MAVRLSGKCDLAGRFRDKYPTNTPLVEHKSAPEQTGSLTTSEADRLCENQKEESILNNGMEKIQRESEWESACDLAVTDVHAFFFFFASPFRSTVASKFKCQCRWRESSVRCHVGRVSADWHFWSGADPGSLGDNDVIEPSRLYRADGCGAHEIM